MQVRGDASDVAGARVAALARVRASTLGIAVAVAAAACTVHGGTPVAVGVQDYPTLDPDDLPIDPYIGPAAGPPVLASVDDTATFLGEAVSWIPIDTDLGDPRAVEKLVVDVWLPSYEVPSLPNQVAERKDLRTQRVTIVPGPSAKVAAADRKAALVATSSIDADNADVRATAKAAIDGVRGRSAQVTHLVEWVYSSIPYQLSPETVASDVLRVGHGQCYGKALLFVAMARAVKIPARMVTGLVPTELDDGRDALGFHAWAEVEIDHHWVQVDPTWNETQADATHLALVEGDWSPTGETFDGIGVAIVDVTRGTAGEADARELARQLPVNLSLRRR